MIACFSWGRADAQRDERAVREQSIKYQRLMQMIDAVYVDTVNLGKLTEDAIIKVLADLDPHSVYISREEVEEANEPLEGGFFGIGIQFNILRDTLMVVDVVPGGPAEKVGMMAGGSYCCDRWTKRGRGGIDQHGGPEEIEGREGNPCECRRLAR